MIRRSPRRVSAWAVCSNCMQISIRTQQGQQHPRKLRPPTSFFRDSARFGTHSSPRILGSLDSNLRPLWGEFGSRIRVFETVGGEGELSGGDGEFPGCLPCVGEVDGEMLPPLRA